MKPFIESFHCGVNSHIAISNCGKSNGQALVVIWALWHTIFAMLFYKTVLFPNLRQKAGSQNSQCHLIYHSADGISNYSMFSCGNVRLCLNNAIHWEQDYSSMAIITHRQYLSSGKPFCQFMVHLARPCSIPLSLSSRSFIHPHSVRRLYSFINRMRWWDNSHFHSQLTYYKPLIILWCWLALSRVMLVSFE